MGVKSTICYTTVSLSLSHTHTHSPADFLSFFVSFTTAMFDSVVDFISQAASSSAFIFCFCNLIIVIILLDLKPSSKFDQESAIPVSVVTNTGMNHKPAASNSKNLADENTQLRGVEEVLNAKEEADLVENIVTEANDVKICSNEEEEEEEEDEDDDDALRRRVEEFIEKVNKRWKEELLVTSSLV